MTENEQDDPRRALHEALSEAHVSMQTLSEAIDKKPGYVHDYLKRNNPQFLTVEVAMEMAKVLRTDQAPLLPDHLKPYVPETDIPGDKDTAADLRRRAAAYRDCADHLDRAAEALERAGEG